MYFDEDLVLDLRLNYLANFVDKFVIIESAYNHKGEKRKLQFDIKNFQKFENKIIYLPSNKIPNDIQEINTNDSEDRKYSKQIINALKRENSQRNQLEEGLSNADQNDWVIISDIDEIPNLENLRMRDIKNKLLFFKQQMMYYKFNLRYENFVWVGSKACRKKDLISPQWLRNIKDRNYPWWRIDIYFSKLKYSNIKFVENGGWHFSYIKTPELIEKKLKSYAHHREYDLNSLGIQKIKNKIQNKESIYDLKTDMRKSKFNSGQKLTVLETNELPVYIQNNLDKYKQWLEQR